MKSFLKVLLVSIVSIVLISSFCLAQVRWGAFSEIDGTPCGLLMRIDKTWDVQLSYSNTGAGAVNAYALKGTYYFTAVRALEFGVFGEYLGGTGGMTTISLGGSVRHQLFQEVGLKADAYVISLYSGTASGSDIFPLGACIAFTIVI